MEALSLGQYIVQWPQSHFTTPSQSLSHLLLCIYCIMEGVSLGQYIVQWPQSHSFTTSQSLSRVLMESWKHLSHYQCIVHPLCFYHFLVQLLYQYIVQSLCPYHTDAITWP